MSCGGTKNYTDESNISWTSDAAYINTGNINNVDGLTFRVFPDFQVPKCYKLPIRNVSSSVLVRSQFVYKNYDGLNKPPSFNVSLGTAMLTTTIDLAANDPWIEEFLWPVEKDTLSFCIHNIPDKGFPVISSLELRPQPQGAYQTGIDNYQNKLLRKSYRINCGYVNGTLRY